MSTRYQRLQKILEWVKINTVNIDDLSEYEDRFSPEMLESLKNEEGHNWISYDEETRILKLSDIELAHTSSPERVKTIEELPEGSKLQLVVNDDVIVVTDCMGNEIGSDTEMSHNLVDVINNNDVEILSVVATKVIPKSMRGKGARKAIVEITAEIKLLPCDTTGTKCIFVKTEGDQVQGWHQKIDVIYSSMPVEDAKLLFMVWNRIKDEYNDENTDVGYAGLDNLVDEIIAARAKMRSEKNNEFGYDRLEDIEDEEEYTFASYVENAIYEDSKYRNLLKYVSFEDMRYGASFENYYEPTILDVKTYYWEDQVRCTSKEYDKNDYFHRYEVIELFEGDTLPVDFDDEDVVSIFGTGKFVAFADLSYGC